MKSQTKNNVWSNKFLKTLFGDLLGLHMVNLTEAFRCYATGGFLYSKKLCGQAGITPWLDGV
jgi:hypothetical protein